MLGSTIGFEIGEKPQAALEEFVVIQDGPSVTSEGDSGTVRGV